MSVDKLVDSTQLDSDLTSVANAIRTKGGTSAQLAFPAGFVQAIGDIETGGGGFDIMDTSQPTGAVVSDVTGMISAYSLYKRTGVTSLHLTKAISLTNYAIQGCTEMKTFVGEKLTLIAGNGLRDCTTLNTVDILGSSRINDSALINNSALTALVIRATKSVVTLGSSDAFKNTPFASDGTGGTLYVPQALIADYQAASNWSKILGYETNQILPIEGSIYETQYADGTPITA